MGYTNSDESNMASTTPIRSTKGASKHRRDLINTEINQLRDILPLQESSRMRLSQLQIMSLTCCYIRKCNHFTRLFGNTSGQSEVSQFDFSQAMTGFLLITTREGKLLYISENVTEYLGHSMVDMMTQGDCLYDIIDKRDHAKVQAELLQPNYTPSIGEEKTFFCHMNVSRSFRRHAGFGDHKVMHVRGHFIQPLPGDHYGSQPVFMATCTPLVTPDVKETSMQHNTLMFQSVHSLNMSYIEIAPNAEYHLGYTDAEMKGKSWYGLLHPEDIHDAKEKHIQLVKSSHEMGCMLTVRLQNANGSWIWVNMVMHIRQPFICDNGEPAIVCINHVISDTEAPDFKIQSQLYSSQIARTPDFLDNSTGSSPQHTITQMPIDEDSLQFPSHESEVRFSGQFDVIPTTMPLQQPHSQRTESSCQYTMNSRQDATLRNGLNKPQQQQLSPQQKLDQKQDILNRLKRKLQPEECRSPKQQCFSIQDNHNNHGHDESGFNIRASVIAHPLITTQRITESAGNHCTIMGSMHMPVYSQLNIKKEAILIESQKINQKIARMDMSYPIGPLTPESVTSEIMDGSNGATTQLCIDVNDSAVVPDSVLTPDSSPIASPIYANNYNPYPSDNDNGMSFYIDLPGQQKLLKPTMNFSSLETNTFVNSPIYDMMSTDLLCSPKQEVSLESEIAEIAEIAEIEAELKKYENEQQAARSTQQAALVPMRVNNIPVSVEALDDFVPQFDTSTTLAQSVTEELIEMSRTRGGKITIADITDNLLLDESLDESTMSYFKMSILADDAPSPLGGDVEFQQLRMFNITSPSHGEVDQLSTVAFDSTL